MIYIKKVSSIVQKYNGSYLNLENYLNFLPPSSCNYPVVATFFCQRMSCVQWDIVCTYMVKKTPCKKSMLDNIR